MEILALIVVSKLFVALAFMAVASMVGMAGEFGSTVDCAMPLESAVQTKTATAHGTALDMGAGFDASGAGGQPSRCQIPISAADFGSGDETYSFQMEESTDNATFTACGAAVAVASTDVGRSIIINGTFKNRYIRYTLTIGGTTPTISYGPAYLEPRRIGRG